ncbi:LysM peptidoglycan-binding domain-containing protein [Rhodococcus erythropolis]|uniref:LysM peptidoglycan-binding domain-containing protein n=1 Tax=Rhodococcus erythropolis TaxID=1833 RepID=UPI001F49163B|nr:LysM peptidoglycan-binding domain-containing protein [Rhodococcus erythropolis]UJC78569.1 LysM peptidoglycan-binding domain-containing protein [Rhodococcus erythropolis]
MRSIERMIEHIDRCRPAEVTMGNAALQSNRIFDDAISVDAIGVDAIGFDGTSALKYHPSFYGPDGGSDADVVSFERRGTAEMRGVARYVDNEPQAAVVRRVPVGAVSGSRSLRESPRRWDSEHDSSRPYGGSFAHRNRVGVSRVEHEVAAEDVSWKTVFLGTVFTALAVLALVGIGALSSGDVAGTHGATEVVRVAAGESLSDIAAKVAPGQAVGSVIEQIMDLNAMSSSGLSVGQTLIVPVSGR